LTTLNSRSGIRAIRSLTLGKANILCKTGVVELVLGVNQKHRFRICKRNNLDEYNFYPVNTSNAIFGISIAGWDFASAKVLNLLSTEGSTSLDSTASVEVRKLEFYSGLIELVRVTGFWAEGGEKKYFLYNGSNLTRLNGTSPPIYGFNANHGLNFNSRTALSYLSFFGFFVRGELGPFFYYDRSFTDYYTIGASLDFSRELAKKRLSPPRCVETGEKDFDCNLSIFYGNALFDVQMKLENSGRVSMVSDEALLTGLDGKIVAPIAAF